MKHVTFGVAEHPYSVGDKRVVPDGVAEQLQDRGLISACEPWPVRQRSGPQKGKRPEVRPERPAGALDKRMAE